MNYYLVQCFAFGGNQPEMVTRIIKYPELEGDPQGSLCSKQSPTRVYLFLAGEEETRSRSSMKPLLSCSLLMQELPCSDRRFHGGFGESGQSSLDH